MLAYFKKPYMGIYVWVILFCASSSSAQIDIAYEKVIHPSKMEGVLSRIQKNWILQKRALAKVTANRFGSGALYGDQIRVVLQPEHGKLSQSIDVNGLIGINAKIVAQSRHLMEVSVSVDALEKLTHISGVGFVRFPYESYTERVISEGVERIQASAYTRKGHTGRGIRVGVIDLGFAGVPQLQAQGELPNVRYKDFSGEGIFAGTEVHGAACAEIVHDIAPDAQIYLYKVRGILSWENAKDAAIQDGLDIVTVSLSNIGTGFGDGLGLACEIADDAFQNNVLWVNSAGNYAQSQISAQFNDTDNDEIHNFSDGNEIVRLRNVNVGDTISGWLVWDDWPLTLNDYDLILVRINPDGSTTTVEVADTRQYQSPPLDRLVYKVEEAGTYGFAVWAARGSERKLFKLRSQEHAFEDLVSVTGSLGTPADARGALTVGALNQAQWAQGPIESFSSLGPTVDGRSKPDLVAPDGVLTVSYGSGGYFGTSAATPHVAGAAALLKASNPTYYNAQRLYDALTRSVVDMGSFGKDNVYGTGRLELSLLPVGEPVLTLSQQRLDFGTSILGASQSLDLGFVNTGNASLVIENLLFPQPDFQLSKSSFVVAPGRSTQVTLTFTPQSAGDKSGNLTVVSNLSNTQIVRVVASGSQQPIVPMPQIVMDTAVYDFGSVELGQVESHVWVISNFGEATLSLSNITSNNSQIQVTPSQLNIPAKQTGLFTARFQPIQEGPVSAQLTMRSNDPESSIITIPITGNGSRSQTSLFTMSLLVNGTQPNTMLDLPLDGKIVIQIQGHEIRDAIGFRALFEFDESLITYEGFDVGIPNGQSPGPYYPSDHSSVEVMAASLGGKISQQEAHLGTIHFQAKEAFQTGQIHMRQARIRRSGQFEVLSDEISLTFSRNEGRQGDFDRDGTVGFTDFLAFSGHYSTTRGQDNYDAIYDLDGDGRIGFGDFLIFANNYGKS